MDKYYSQNRLQGLKKISDAFKKLKINFTIFDGALLGFIRDEKLIEWDWDAEIALEYEEYRNNLLNILKELDNCRLGKLILNPNIKNPKISIITPKTKFGDFKYTITPYMINKDKKIIYRDLYQYPSKYILNLEKIKIDNYYFPIPQNAKDLLILQYGKEWSTPLKSKKKNEYLNKDVYTKSNNRLNQTITYLFQLILKIRIIIKNFILRLIKKFPKFEYKLKLHREQLFIYQLLWLIKNNKRSTLIEIGSSDLSEFITLNSIVKKYKFQDIVYEASKNNFDKLVKINLNRKYKNLKIINKAVLPDDGKYFLQLDVNSNLNRIINNENSIYNSKEKIKNGIYFSDIKELKNNKINKIIKMDIEGFEEELLIKNLSFLKELTKINIIFEIHPNKYNQPKQFLNFLKNLIHNGYKIKFVELSKYCNPKLLEKFKNKNKIISSHKGRHLISNPDNEILNEICFTDYQLINKFPYFKSKNIRSVTLSKG